MASIYKELSNSDSHLHLFRMTKTLSLVSHKNYYLNANEGFVIFLISKLITCFIGHFTSKIESQSIAYFLYVNEHIYWIWDLEDELHSIWVIWTSGHQECKANFIFQSRVERAGSMGFIRAVKEVCPGRSPTLGKCDLARGMVQLL